MLARHCKPSLSVTDEVRDPRKESTVTSAFLNPYTSNYVLHTYAYTHRGVQLAILIKEACFFFSSQQEMMESIRENDNWSKCREQQTVGYPFPRDTCTSQPLQ